MICSIKSAIIILWVFFVGDDQLGMATADLSTGMFRTSERAAYDLWEVLERLGPSEVLAPESWVKDNEASLKRECRVHCSHI